MVGVVKVFARKPELHTPALVWFLSACVADILITVSLVRSLVSRTLIFPIGKSSNLPSRFPQSQRKTGFAATDSVIDKIIRSE